MKLETADYIKYAGRNILAPRYVVAIYFDDTDVTYITSHNDCITPVVDLSDRIDGCITEISGMTQSIKPTSTRHSIGNVTFKLLDVNKEISAKITAKLNENKGLKGKKILLYKAHSENDNWSDYSRRLTFLIENIKYKNGEYTIQCADIQRTMKSKIFQPDIAVLTSTISATDMLIPVTSEDASTKFFTVAHDSGYTADPSITVGYIKIDDEIISHKGWDVTETNLIVIERGAMGTSNIIHKVTATEVDKKKKIEEYIYLEMTVPKLIYAILTGILYGQTAILPAHWNLDIPDNFVRHTDFTEMGDDVWNLSTDKGLTLRFMGLEEQDGKKFIEDELLKWLVAFMPVYSDGSLGLRLRNPVLPYSPYIEYLDESQIVNYSELEYDQKSVVNNLSVNWNWVDSLSRTTRSTQVIDSDSIQKYGAAEKKELTFKGVFTGSGSAEDVKNFFTKEADRLSAPPLKHQITVLPEWDRMEVGDTVRVDNEHVHDYNSGETLARTFEIQQVKTNWRTGLNDLTLFGGVGESNYQSLSENYVLNDFFYTIGADLSTVLTISNDVVTQSATLGGGTYYYDGDLEIPDGVEVTLTSHVELRIKGHFAVNGDINGVGRGHAGAISTTTKYGLLGTKGIRYPVYSRGIEGDLSNLSSLRNIAPIQQSGGISYSYSPVSSKNIRNLDGIIIQGLPDDLRGSSGSSGGWAEIHDYIDPGNSNDKTGGIVGSGGQGGDSGAGLVIVSRGGSFGVNGGIDLSGTDGSLGGSGSTAGTNVTLHSGSGIGGGAGGMMWLIDGNESIPSKLNVVMNSGVTPVPNVDLLVNSNIRYSRGANSIGVKPRYTQDDQRGDNLVIRPLFKAINGYVWFPADEVKEATGYNNKPPEWDDIRTSPFSTGRYDKEPLRDFYDLATINIDNNAGNTTWYKVAEVTHTSSHDGFSFKGSVEWGGSGGRYLYNARVLLTAGTSATEHSYGTNLVIASTNNDSGFNDSFRWYRVDNGSNYTWTLYVKLNSWTSMRMAGEWHYHGSDISHTYIDDNQTAADSLGAAYAPAGVWLVNQYNYEAGADVTQAHTGGSSVNVASYEYSVFEAIRPTGMSIGNGTYAYDTAQKYFGLYSLRLSATANDSWLFLGTNNSDYNIKLSPHKKWIVSAYVRSSSANSPGQFYIKTSDGQHHQSVNFNTVLNTWTRVSGVIDLTASDETSAILRLDNDGGAGVEMWFDGIMIEEQVGDLTEPSAYSYPSVASGRLGVLDTVGTSNIDDNALSTVTVVGGEGITSVDGFRANDLEESLWRMIRMVLPASTVYRTIDITLDGMVNADLSTLLDASMAYYFEVSSASYNYTQSLMYKAEATTEAYYRGLPSILDDYKMSPVSLTHTLATPTNEEVEISLRFRLKGWETGLHLADMERRDMTLTTREMYK